MAHIAGSAKSLRRDKTARRGPDVERLLALQAFNARLVCMTVDESSFQEVVNGVWKVMGCDFCALFLHDDQAGALKLTASAVVSSAKVTAASVHAWSGAQAFTVISPPRRPVRVNRPSASVRPSCR